MVLSEISLFGKNALCCGLIIEGMTFLILFAIVFIMILRITLQRAIGLKSEGKVGFLTLGIRQRKV